MPAYIYECEKCGYRQEIYHSESLSYKLCCINCGQHALRKEERNANL